MRKIKYCALLLAALLVTGAASKSIAADGSSYAGLENREIKALSEEKIEAYEQGAGMGLAMAAELNRYPGPKHVLELDGQLELTEGQRNSTQARFAEMKSSAVDLGRQIVEQEHQLDRAFSSQAITEGDLTQRVGKIAELQGQLRAVHLRAHLKMVEILTPEQVARYDSLRGYANGHGHSSRDHGEQGHEGHHDEKGHEGHEGQHGEKGHEGATCKHGEKCPHGKQGHKGEGCAHGEKGHEGGSCPQGEQGHKGHDGESCPHSAGGGEDVGV